MLRKTIVIVPIILLALGGCTKSNDAPVTGEQAGPTIGAPAPSTSPTTSAACPTTPTRKLAKTRFIANAGLAAGAFKRYIYDSHKAGKFKAGAPGRKAAIIKAAAAGLFITDQLRRARTNVQADPTLCRVLREPLDRLTAAASGLADRFKRGQVDVTDIAAVSGGLEGFRRTAGSAGAGFKNKDVPASMIGA